jgi:predicted transposase YbfD/YdcC
VARAHWGIENGLHWTLDVVFGEDRCRQRTQHGPENWAMLNPVALSLVKSERATKGSLTCKRKRAGWQAEYLLQLLSSGA